MKTMTDPAAKAEVVERFRKLSPNAERKWGKMTAHQMVCHLNDSHLLIMGEIKGTGRSNFLNRTIIKFAALRTPMKWPPGVPTVPELDQVAAAGTKPKVFENDLARLLELMDRLTAPKRDFEFAPHPIFAEMTEWEWMRWAYLHADHHLRQFGL
jgi:hypothetical protein